jgi:hypothetical protein
MNGSALRAMTSTPGKGHIPSLCQMKKLMFMRSAKQFAHRVNQDGHYFLPGNVVM